MLRDSMEYGRYSFKLVAYIEKDETLLTLTLTFRIHVSNLTHVSNPSSSLMCKVLKHSNMHTLPYKRPVREDEKEGMREQGLGLGLGLGLGSGLRVCEDEGKSMREQGLQIHTQFL